MSGSNTYPTNITPIVTGVALTTASIQVVAQNPSRRAIMFHNRSASLSLEVAGAPIVAGQAGSMLIFPGGFSPVFAGDIRATIAFNAHMVTGSGDITIFEWP